MPVDREELHVAQQSNDAMPDVQALRLAHGTDLQSRGSRAGDAIHMITPYRGGSRRRRKAQERATVGPGEEHVDDPGHSIRPGIVIAAPALPPALVTNRYNPRPSLSCSPSRRTAPCAPSHPPAWFPLIPCGGILWPPPVGRAPIRPQRARASRGNHGTSRAPNPEKTRMKSMSSWTFRNLAEEALAGHAR